MREMHIIFWGIFSVILDMESLERDISLWGWGEIVRRRCTGRAQWGEYGQVVFMELSVFGFLSFHVTRKTLGGCSMMEGMFVFDVHECGKGSVDIV